MTGIRNCLCMFAHLNLDPLHHKLPHAIKFTHIVLLSRHHVDYESEEVPNTRGSYLPPHSVDRNSQALMRNSE